MYTDGNTAQSEITSNPLLMFYRYTFWTCHLISGDLISTTLTVTPNPEEEPYVSGVG